MPTTLYYDDGSHHTHSDEDAVLHVIATSEKPKSGYTRLTREYPPEYVKSGPIRAAVLSPGARVLTNGGYVRVTKVVQHDTEEPPDFKEG